MDQTWPKPMARDHQARGCGRPPRSLTLPAFSRCWRVSLAGSPGPNCTPTSPVSFWGTLSSRGTHSHAPLSRPVLLTPGPDCPASAGGHAQPLGHVSCTHKGQPWRRRTRLRVLELERPAALREFGESRETRQAEGKG